MPEGMRSATPRCGNFLIEARRRNGLSQADVAGLTGMSQTNISRIERDKVSPSLATVNRILEAMGETLVLGSVSIDKPPEGGGNASIRELRSDLENLTPEQRIEQAVLLSKAAGKLAATNPGTGAKKA